MSITYLNNYPNIIVFSSKTIDGVIASYLIKDKYDNNLKNDLWDRNVHVYFVLKSLKSMKELYYDNIELKLVKNQKNVVYLVDPILDSNGILKLWNWCTDKGVDFVWLDHNINNILLLRHLHIPGKQSSLRSTSILTFQFLNENQAIPKFLEIIELNIIEKKTPTFSKEKEVLPLCYFVESLGNALNDNTNDFLIQNLAKIISEEEFLTLATQVGKFIYNYLKLKNPINL